nr:plasma membrane ATPase 1-like [Tanacetum cinerariifolium]
MTSLDFKLGKDAPSSYTVEGSIVIAGSLLPVCDSTLELTRWKKKFGKEDRELNWAEAQRTLPRLDPPEVQYVELNNHNELNQMAEDAKRRAEMTSAGEEDEYSLVNFFLKQMHFARGLQACAKAGKLVDEEPYEVFLDTHGASGGPKVGRLRVKETSCLTNVAPKKWHVLRHEMKSRTHDEVEFCNSEMKLQCSHNSRICELALPASKRPKQQDMPKRAGLRESIRQN